MPPKKVIALNSEPLFAIDSVMERDRFLENYDMMMGSEFDRQHQDTVGRMGRTEKREYEGFVREMREAVAQRTQQRSEEEQRLRREAEKQHKLVVNMHKSIREFNKTINALNE